MKSKTKEFEYQGKYVELVSEPWDSEISSLTVKVTGYPHVVMSTIYPNRVKHITQLIRFIVNEIDSFKGDNNVR